MLRKDKALLESLTRKYGKDNLLNEMYENSQDGTELMRYTIPQKYLNGNPIFMCINTTEYPGDAGVITFSCDNMEFLYEYGFDEEVNDIWKLKVGEAWQNSFMYAPEDVIIVRVA